MEELRAKGVGLAAISYDRSEILAEFSRRHGITFPLLSDVGSATIKAFGILNTVAEEAVGPNRDDPAVAADVHKLVAGAGVRPDPARIGMAFPGTFVVDRQGRVTSRFFEDLYVERNTVSSLLKKAGGRTEVAGTTLSTPQLEITTSATDSSVAPGNRFSLVVGVEPHRGIHLYAPGAAGYRVVTLTIAPQRFVRILPVTYPASDMYFFKPLNERVPVYQKRFTLLQDVVVEGTRDAQAALRGKDALTLTGALEYQACDEKICFNPASVPLSWTLTLRSLVTGR